MGWAWARATLLYTLFEDSDLNAYPLPMRLPLLPACLELLHLRILFLALSRR